MNRKIWISIVCVISVTLPFAIANVVLAATQPKSACMDKPHSIIVLRKFMMAAGIIELELIVVLSMLMFFFYLGCFDLHTLRKFLYRWKIL